MWLECRAGLKASFLRVQGAKTGEQRDSCCGGGHRLRQDQDRFMDVHATSQVSKAHLGTYTGLDTIMPSPRHALFLQTTVEWVCAPLQEWVSQ